MGDPTTDHSSNRRRFRGGECASIALATVLLLGGHTGPILEARTAGSAVPKGAQSLAGSSVFTSLRHGHAVAGEGPYRVSVRQLSGEAPNGGAIVYVVRQGDGAPSAPQRSALQRERDGVTWTGAIPQQRSGSHISYHFEFALRERRSVRHPAHADAWYAMRVVPLRVRAVSLPKAPELRQVALMVDAPSPPNGEVVVRRLSASATFPEARIKLSSRRESTGSYVLRGLLPPLSPGEVADFYFELRAQGGATARVPADAPAQLYTVKRSARAVGHLAVGDVPVLGVARLGEERWLATRGSGAWRDVDGRARSWGLKDGLETGLWRSVIADPVTSNVYLGSELGVAVIEPGRESWRWAAAPRPNGFGAEVALLARFGFERRAGPVAISPLDGSVLFQLQGGQAFEQAFPAAAFFEIRDGELRALSVPGDGMALIGWSTATFDEAEGCWLIGGFEARTDRDLVPVILQRCGNAIRRIPLPASIGEKPRVVPRRVVALARDPEDGSMLAALELQEVGEARPNTWHGVYRLTPAGGASPAADDIARIGAQITALVTDWPRTRVLVGTVGRGLLQVRGRKVEPVGPNRPQLRDITSLQVDPVTGQILAGTTAGAYDMPSDGRTAVPVVASRAELLPADALPMDVSPNGSRVVLSSYSEGLFDIERNSSGVWRSTQSLRLGKELPNGNLGDAQYLRGESGKAAVLHSRGLVLVRDTALVLGLRENLASSSILRLLSRRSGDLWVAHTPIPNTKAATGVLQVVRDGRVVRTVPLNDASVATIGRWIDVAERNSVFAATQSGVIELGDDGSVTRRSQFPVAAIAREGPRGVIGVVGATVERWNGDRFEPVLFQIDHPRFAKGAFRAGVPLDLAISSSGDWYVLFAGGRIVVLDAQGQYRGLLDGQDGIPVSARRMLIHPASGDLLVGSMREGVAVVKTRSARAPRESGQ